MSQFFYDTIYKNYGNVQEFLISPTLFPVDKHPRPRLRNPEALKCMWEVVEWEDKDGITHKTKIPTEHYEEYKDNLNRQRSYRRSMDAYFGYAYSNTWTHFVTFTFNPKLVDRYDAKECYRQLRNWVKNYRKQYDPALRLLAVMEPHKDEAVHFHALVYSENLETYYNGFTETLTTFGLGYTDVKPIAGTREDRIRVANYVSKYMAKSQYRLNARRYHVFGKLKQAVKTVIRYRDMKPYIDDLLKTEYCYRKKRKESTVILKFTTAFAYDFYRTSIGVEDIAPELPPRFPEQLSMFVQ